ncbi:MAG: hypothetical protein ACRD3W_25955, partial [Terriglobales bacterium]
ALVVGVGAFYGLNYLTNNAWHTQLTLPLSIVIACVPALVTFFVTKHAAGFAEDCLEIPTAGLAPALHGSTRGGCASGQCARKTGGKGSNAELRGTGLASATARAIVNNSIDVSAANGTLVKTDNITVDTAEGDNHAVTITVTTIGISNSRLKILFARLNGVSGIKWENHKNLGNGRKQVVGTLAANGDRAGIFSRLMTVTEKFS